MSFKSTCRLLVLFVASYVSPPMPVAGADAAVSLSSYHVSTRIHSRLLKTSIAMVFDNSEECSSVYGITLQLPRGARATDLTMDLSSGCRLESRVKILGAARDDFDAFAAEGKAAAILTAWDMSNYELGVSVPPNGTTHVLLKYQELLFQKLDRVDFQVPLFPGIAVGDLKVDVFVEEPISGVVELQTEVQDETFSMIMDGGKATIATATMHHEYRGLTAETSLPTLLQAYFRPGPLPEKGLFLSDGDCFTHVLNPSTLLSGAGPMARKIVFVIDVSGSMLGQKLDDAKASFAVMIDTLDERDTFIVQSFSDKGTEDKWGPNSGDDTSKENAKAYVMTLSTLGGTNLNQAFLDGIASVYDAPDTVAPILVALTDGQGNSGARDIARNVRAANKGDKVKIFSLAFGMNADVDLLLGIAIQNGGRAVRIYEGYGDAAKQMALFYKQELGTILMSDIGISYDFGTAGASDSTVQRFPVFAAGSEIVVRGRMDSPTAVNVSRSLKSIVSANSAVGPKQWALDHVAILDNSNSDCRQSFAQARIMELLDYSDAERSLGDELFVTAVATARSFQEEAQTIALDAHLVWPGLTALVTVENANCEQNDSKVCYSGNGHTSNGRGDNYEAKVSPTGRASSGCFLYSCSLIYIVLSSIVLAF